MNTKQIRQKILDLAILGELVPQDPTDEPASVLLERIRAEKEQLIKDKKLKRDKTDNEPIEEIPFELPEGWVWCRLGEIGIWGSGVTPSRNKKEYYDGNIPWLKTGDLNDSYIYETSELISDLAVKEYSLKMIPIGSILIAMYGATIAKLGLLEIEVTTNQACCTCTPFSGIVNKFLFHYLFSQKQNIKNKAEGGAQPNISKEKLINFLFPLPPLTEQHRIVEKVEQLFALVDTIEQLQEELKALIKQTRNQVLNYAIAGKLTHQDPNDEPAEELLKRIGKTTAPDTPYEKLPKGWAWCQGNQILNTMKSQKPSGEKFNYIDIASIDNRQNKITEVKTIAVTDAPSRASRKVKFGDTLFSMVRPYLKNIAFVDEEYSNCIASTGFYVCSPNEALFPKYLFYLMVSDYVVQGLNKHMKGDNSPSINNEDITNFIFPLAPLAEQYRIVEKIESFFASFNQIEKELA